MSRKAVFLDRDGVINAYVYNPEFGTVDSPANPREFSLLPGVAEAIAKLNDAGLLAIVVSNQPGIGKGKMSPRLFDQIHAKMGVMLEKAGAKIDAAYYCLHHPEARLAEYRVTCECRKPKSGLLLRASREWNIDLEGSYMVGDGVVDVQAGRAAGTMTFLLGARRCYVCDELNRQDTMPDFMAASLLEAVELINQVENGVIFAGAQHSRDGRRRPADPCGYVSSYLREASEILQRVDPNSIERVLELLARLREAGGRLFLLGVGGGAGHASHAACDFRKIAQIEAYCPSDNVSELTARVNDDGWETAYVNWLRGCRLGSKDMVFVFSVGGGDCERNISANLVRALQYAKQAGATVCGVVGRNGGYTVQVADACVLIPVVNPSTVTAHTESFQALVWHLLVSHPKLKASEMKWESVR